MYIMDGDGTIIMDGTINIDIIQTDTIDLQILMVEEVEL